MKERITITIPEWLIDYMSLEQTNNKSDRICEYITKGVLAEDGQIEKKNKALFMIKEDNKIKDQEIRKLKAYIGQLESMDKKSKFMQRRLNEPLLAEDVVSCDVCSDIISAIGKRHKFPVGIVCNTCFETSNKSETWMKGGD